MAVDDGTTIMEACEQLGISIPRLCYHPDLSLQGSCRVCVVEVKGMGFYMTSCSQKVWEGMEVQTNSPDIRQARRDIVELLLDNHPKDCQTCERDGNCELQNLAYSLGVRARHFEGRRKEMPIDLSSHSVVRDAQKCVLCGRCVRVCGEIQGVHNLSQQGRGFETVVSPAHGAKMDESVCIQCGQCINVCPTAAFLEKRSAGGVWDAIADPEMHVVVQTAPSIRAAIGEGFGLPAGTPCTGKMVTALRRLGFDAVFDTDFAADLTIIEEAHEFLTRLKEGPLPMITSCSPGWINFMERFYPELIPHASTCRSPMSMMSALIKTYYAKKKGIDPKKIYVVAVMPCVAKKYEAHRPEHFIELPSYCGRGAGSEGAAYRRRADHARVDMDDQVLRHQFHHAARRRVRRAVGPGQRGRRHLRHDRRRDGSYAPRRGRTGHRQAGRPPGVHRGPRGGGPPRGLRGHRRAQHPRRRGQRPGERQDDPRQGQGRQGVVPRDRGHGLSRRLHRRRRPALSGRRLTACSIPNCCASGRRHCTASIPARSSANRTRTRPSRRFTTSSSWSPVRKSPINSCIPATVPNYREASDEPIRL